MDIAQRATLRASLKPLLAGAERSLIYLGGQKGAGVAHPNSEYESI